MIFWPLTDTPDILVGKKIIETYGQTVYQRKRECHISVEIIKWAYPYVGKIKKM